MKACFEFPTPNDAARFVEAMLGRVGVKQSHRVVDIHAESAYEVDDARKVARTFDGEQVDASVRGAAMLSKDSLLDAAREGAELGTCDED